MQCRFFSLLFALVFVGDVCLAATIGQWSKSLNPGAITGHVTEVGLRFNWDDQPPPFPGGGWPGIGFGRWLTVADVGTSIDWTEASSTDFVAVRDLVSNGLDNRVHLMRSIQSAAGGITGVGSGRFESDMALNLGSYGGWDFSGQQIDRIRLTLEKLEFIYGTHPTTGQPITQIETAATIAFISNIPEPATLLLLGIPLMTCARRTKRQHSFTCNW